MGNTSQEKHRKTGGKLEIQRKSMGNPMENHGEIMPNQWKINGKAWEGMGKHGQINENHHKSRKMMRIEG